ncbi:polyadenylate-binding protein-interacting protein 5 [Gastrolobium bilobum]|uniref:polyadenylate-binding protein-interacting protein 5 n=1 Tax=Gastrolobium bilobum TaxID=150636 RepID=UPI002AB2A608|nr:polyadenylate-binding protein-interacting protein 5 [Gastrolobium bilobum]XP_061359593.1 polyadenylate-binding protein-interacting protein 5 [Gastrolobium bilobum]
MKPRASNLNPYAASYVPMSRRLAEGGTSGTEKGSQNYDGTVWFQNPQHTTKVEQLMDSSTKRLSSVKAQPASSSYSSSSQNVRELRDKQLLDEELDMDMEFLRMSFPDISHQSLVDVYTVNGGDVEAAIDMLNQLEFDGVEYSGTLPDTLDIGDVPESGVSADSASAKQKDVTVEAGTSSSHMASANDL